MFEGCPATAGSLKPRRPYYTQYFTMADVLRYGRLTTPDTFAIARCRAGMAEGQRGGHQGVKQGRGGPLAAP